ncbi:MAG: hypothetical protein P4L59_16430 [Desulfosporosinus sp.]|nr:hypothetical protein [Desulfosporosinus sp.]
MINHEKINHEKILTEHTKLLREIMDVINKHDEAILLLGEKVMEDEYYTVHEFAAITGQKLKPGQVRLLMSIAFQLSRRRDVPVDGDQYRIDILQEAFEWSF